MKTLTILISAALFFSACKEECVTCTEPITQIETSHCGEESELDFFENTLKQQSASQGITWNCERN